MMEELNNMRRSQSLRDLPLLSDKAVWTHTGLRDKTKSVLQLVARYQTTVTDSTFVQPHSVIHDQGNKGRVLEKTFQATPPEKKESDLDSLLRRNEEKQQSGIKETLSRSKSMSSLQSSPGAIGTLRAMFESKASTQENAKLSTRAANFPSQHTANVSVKIIVAKEVQKAAEEQPTNRDVPNENQTAEKQDKGMQKVMNQTWVERRKTIGGIDFQMIAASQADEKRRSIADFRDNSFIETKGTLSVSVKAMSALYLSKVAPQEKEQDPSGDLGKRGKPVKMAECSTFQRGQDGLSFAAGDVSRVHPQQTMQFSREMLHQQRQKCELRRLLKHTHPELRKLDDVVDEELAEVLSLESDTAAETGYEGEVFSRRLKFESCGLSDNVFPYNTKMHLFEEKEEGCSIREKTDIFEAPDGKRGPDSVKEIPVDEKCLGYSPYITGKQSDEEMLQIDVQRTRMIFENQSTKEPSPNQDNKIKGQDSERENQPKEKAEICSNKNENLKLKNNNLTHNQPHNRVSCIPAIGIEHRILKSEEKCTEEKDFESIPDLADCIGSTKPSQDISLNNPFDSKNIDGELCFVHKSNCETTATDCEAGEEKRTTNVKTRTHLFESMPFEKIRHQNQDEIETMVENIKETLQFLYHVDVIHSSGSIIEVNETMIAKKAKFSLSENGPKIKYDEVTEGGAQNFILQLLPRVNLKPNITYLKENREKCIEATVVNVPYQQHQFNTTKDNECKTANVAQLVEDILNKDNSLRKGVIIQQDGIKSAEVIVYSLHKYIDEEDVKSYSPLQGAEYSEPPNDTPTIETRNNINESTTNRFLKTPQDQTCAGSLTSEVPPKGNVKLVKSCIEKGDFEYLKTLQDESTSQEKEPGLNKTVVSLSEELHHENAEESSSDWIPVDIMKLKRIFSEDDHIQPKKNRGNAPTSIPAYAGDRNPTRNSSNKLSCELSNISSNCVNKAQTEELPSSVLLQRAYHEDDGRVHQAELVEVVDDGDEISNLHNAIRDLQYSTDAKSLHYSSQKKHTVFSQDSAEESFLSMTPSEDRKVEPFKPTEPVGLEVASWGQNQSSCIRLKESPADLGTQMDPNTMEMGQNPLTVSSDVAAQRLDTNAAQEVNEEVVFEGTIKAALDSLERSNINVTKGDFRAAMIYKNSSNPHNKKPEITSAVSSQVPDTERPYTTTQTESNQKQQRQDVTVENTSPLSLTKTLYDKSTSAGSEKNRRPIGPKPAIPPKPQHLIVRKRNDQAMSTTNSEATPIDASQMKKVHQNPQPLPTSVEAGNLKDKEIRVSQETEISHQAKDSNDTSEKKERTNNHREQVLDAQPEVQNHDIINNTDESHIDFGEVCQKFGGKTLLKRMAPVKPKRVKIAQPVQDATDLLVCIGKQTDDHKVKVPKEDCKVEMRDKKAQAETEDERRQRLSVHMDEIVRGNITAAMEIFDNLRKQEELQTILSRVEKIEQDTSDVDVSSLRTVFENVPVWVVSSDRNTQNNAKEKSKDIKLPSAVDKPQNKISMENVFGDLERASEEIMNLKEQTLARLMDIEGAIKKALYSVSTLKSDSDIAGLSCLFKESFGTTQGSPSSCNISTISIGSSKAKLGNAVGSDEINVKTMDAKAVSAKQRLSPPSSPAFISIQSAAKKKEKTDGGSSETMICQTFHQSPKVEEKFRSTKTLVCNSPAQNRKTTTLTQTGQNRELSVLEVQTDTEGKSILGTKTVKENHEGMDNFGNRFYSTVVTTQPQTTKSSPNQMVISPAATQVTNYPEVRFEFQPGLAEMCSACLKPVYQMEKIMANKCILHKSCFCCKLCKKKLSMYNYAPINGEFYCIFHYQQLFKRKGNYEEGFGHSPHKNRWIMSGGTNNGNDESEA